MFDDQPRDEGGATNAAKADTQAKRTRTESDIEIANNSYRQ